jgi:hypothetical protein
MAMERQRPVPAWALFGAILGPAALMLLRLSPPGRCANCAAPTLGWLTQCIWCDEDVRGMTEPAPEAVPDHVVHGPLTVIEGTGPSATKDRAATRRAPHARRADGAHRSTDSASPSSTPRRGRTVVPPIAAPPLASPSAVLDAANPVQRMRARLGRPGQAATAEEAPATAEVTPAPDQAPRPARDVVLASAVYVTGTRGLQVGSRYGIEIAGRELRILGPVDVDPTAVAFVHSLRPIDATGVKERLIITAGDGRGRLALVFMSVAGSTADGVAAALVEAAAALPPTPQ